ncbi:MAG: hypothetical protein H6563_02830 [Lewinellaceae bacterium]|nr:hypothetical protein [Lewinellaceae bacterium]
MAKLKFLLPFLAFLVLPAFFLSQPSDDWIKENFVVEVHTVDDFIDRFNGDVNQRVLDKWYQLFQKRDITRKEIIYSLFNLRSTEWSESEVEAFIDQAVDNQCPSFLEFETGNWYATVNCDVLFQGQPCTASLVLQIRQDAATGGSEWVIVSMLNPEIFADLCPDRFPYTNVRRKAFLSPMSHGTNFSALKRVFDEKVNLSDCMDFNPNNSLLNTLAWEVYLGDFQLQHINSIEYHFFQVPNWIFVIRQTAREDFNTGWLISELYPATETDVRNYKEECLNLATTPQ